MSARESPLVRHRVFPIEFSSRASRASGEVLSWSRLKVGGRVVGACTMIGTMLSRSAVKLCRSAPCCLQLRTAVPSLRLALPVASEDRYGRSDSVFPAPKSFRGGPLLPLRQHRTVFSNATRQVLSSSTGEAHWRLPLVYITIQECSCSWQGACQIGWKDQFHVQNVKSAKSTCVRRVSAVMQSWNFRNTPL